ncbi:hypothetical protein D9758_007041 [Tetrapyrgos nigripes]|uniref:Uncharacterized protein n=1 Tax=Tetrapyrgos nigripes TaxID=182062 RepID=A0A8H5GDF1_9AGAR|nr:hypothetical protein D9758_007041 [Tetrapyrgos nigripes]
MKIATIAVITAVTLVGYVGARGGASIESFPRSDVFCSGNDGGSGAFFEPNDGECYPHHDSLRVLGFADGSEGCAVTVYTDGDCSENPVIAPVGACFTDIQSFSIDCF